MSRVRGSNTTPELLVRKWLHSKGYRFSLHRLDLPGKPDIVLPRRRTVVFVHGCFWHGHVGCSRSTLPTSNRAYWKSKIDRNMERDKRNARRLRRNGWHVLTIWECMVKSETKLNARLFAPLRRIEMQ